MPETSTNRFDEEAAAWDSNPTTVVSSQRFRVTLASKLPGLTDGSGAYKDKHAIEIGCGTGLLSTQVAPYFATYTGYDTSQGMLDVLNTKLDKLPEGTQLRGVKELLVDPASPSLRGRQYHLATSHLTLHHIPDDALQPTYQLLYDVLAPGGHIVLSDFEETDFSEFFHPKAKWHDVERHGMKRSDIERGLKQAGFTNVSVEESFKLPKGCEDGKTRDFPFLVAMGVKP